MQHYNSVLSLHTTSPKPCNDTDDDHMYRATVQSSILPIIIRLCIIVPALAQPEPTTLKMAVTVHPDPISEVNVRFHSRCERNTVVENRSKTARQM